MQKNIGLRDQGCPQEVGIRGYVGVQTLWICEDNIVETFDKDTIGRIISPANLH